MKIPDQEDEERSSRCFCNRQRALCSFSQAHFGAGTKITVLESGRTSEIPTVKVLQPSKKECDDRTDKTKKTTLVCVVSGFYPDHVSVSWQIDGSLMAHGVVTDGAARRDGEYYSITSRMRVSTSQWSTPFKNFTCTAVFFNGTNSVTYSNWIIGADGVREKYLRITQAAKLSYLVLIMKSSIYGLVVVFMVKKLQVSSGKEKK